MGILKKFYILCFAFLLATSNAIATETTSIAIIPVSVRIQGSNDMAYPRTCELLSDDIANQLNYQKVFNAKSIRTNENILAQRGLAKKYAEFLTIYKTRYLIDYELLQELSSALEVDKVLLVHGDFDVQKAFLHRPLKYQVGVPMTSPVLPLYKYNLSVNLIDPYKKRLIMHKNYTKNFNVREFGIANDVFAENVVPISEIKKFSNSVSPKVVRNINHVLYGGYNSVISEKTDVILTKLRIKEKKSGLSTDGTVTTDGHPFSQAPSTIKTPPEIKTSTPTNSIKTNRQNSYEDWALNNL